MRIEVFTCIEVENEPDTWAIELHECHQRMNPIKPRFVMVHNDISNNDVIYVDNTLTDDRPEKIIEGVTGRNAKGFIEVGFWKIKQNKWF